MRTIATLVSGVAVMMLSACSMNGAPEDVSATKDDLTVSAGSSAPRVCVDNVLCIQGDHWDPVQCKCVPDACVSQRGGPCGGFTQNPCQCAAGLVCVPNRIPDVPGTCEPQRCCPASWDMYACQNADGSSGLSCHNPKLACASSQTCGAGCDFDVNGRCPVCDPIRCPAGEVFDPNACKCVTAACTSAADCTGPLPQLCQVCADGSSACAHWACNAGQCQIAICP